ncbi:hypothetical protein Afil01_29910 [Actinorhabdospora filicis]|uniref:Uncharacterized protein n=1 Tax=Actinorhabdospora filicis TaxID=1785913 RepID=A0A9W6W940_9ACTN|nr:hypothetical protein [Actinorhabdospora filicis]GLZ78184.1 hypothetical protein Afil01_29910 [Actinorhabdospora filicis]
MVKELLGVADIAAMFEVEPKTVSMWRLRYPGFPEPDVVIGNTAGWDPERAAEIRAWESRRPGQGRRAMMADHVQETLRRTFIFRFMRPDDFSSAPIDFPGVVYENGRLAEGMQTKAAEHLIEALHDGGCEIVFQDAGADVVEAVRHVLWDQWTEDEVGGHEFLGELFDDHGRIYHGCTAFDAAAYTLQRLAALGADILPRESYPRAPGRKAN